MRITVRRSTMVKPAEKRGAGSIWLSNLDLLFPATYHLPVVYFYRGDGTANFFDPAVLKAALSRALVEFYPYAGRLNMGQNNRMEINCNGEGVLFVEADCDATLVDLGDFGPEPEVSLVPAVDYSQGISAFPLFLVQLTRFKCGGISFGYANEHHLADGTSGLHFNNRWSDIARGYTDGIPPFFNRSLLSARDPPRPKFTHIEYQPPPSLRTPLDNNSETTFSIFKLTRDQLTALKDKCQEDTLNYSTYEVVTGHVWRSVCMARGLPADQETKLRIPVNGRNRLQPPLPLGFFGNVVFIATPIALCGELASSPLKFAVGKVHEAIARLDDEYLRSSIDYLEVQSGGNISYGSHHFKCPNLAIVSWAMPLYDADFGWGKPVFVGPGIAPDEGKSYLMPDPKDGGLLYAVTLLKQHMKVFEKLLYHDTCHAKL